MRACLHCKTRFEPWINSLQRGCSFDCLAHLARKANERRAAAEQRLNRAKDADARLRIKSRSDWLREAQAAFNAWVRERDATLPCISCGRMHKGQWHAGHYLSTGARPELRFEPDNVHRQCQPCNTHLHGNLVLYRVELIQRIGLERVEWLEGPHPVRRHTIEELKAIKAKYNRPARDLLAQTIGELV